MNIAFSFVINEAGYHKRQPNSMIVLGTGSSIYAPVNVIGGTEEECKERLHGIIEELFQEYKEKSGKIPITLK